MDTHSINPQYSASIAVSQIQQSSPHAGRNWNKTFRCGEILATLRNIGFVGRGGMYHGAVQDGTSQSPTVTHSTKKPTIEGLSVLEVLVHAVLTGSSKWIGNGKTSSPDAT